MALLTSPDFEGVSLYHGSTDETPDLVRPGRMTTWWHSMPHDDYLDPKWGEADEDHNRELGAELRTAYANQVYEAFRTADDPVLRLMAETHGLEGLVMKVGSPFPKKHLSPGLGI